MGTCILNLIACTSALAGMTGGGSSSSSSTSFGSFSKSSGFFLSEKNNVERESQSTQVTANAITMTRIQGIVLVKFLEIKHTGQRDLWVQLRTSMIGHIEVKSNQK